MNQRYPKTMEMYQYRSLTCSKTSILLIWIVVNDPSFWKVSKVKSRKAAIFSISNKSQLLCTQLHLLRFNPKLSTLKQLFKGKLYQPCKAPQNMLCAPWTLLAWITSQSLINNKTVLYDRLKIRSGWCKTFLDLTLAKKFLKIGNLWVLTKKMSVMVRRLIC